MIEPWEKPHAPRPDRQDSPYNKTAFGFTHWFVKDMIHLGYSFVTGPVLCWKHGHDTSNDDTNERCSRCGVRIR